MAESQGRVRIITSDGEFERELREAGETLVVVDFTADWWVKDSCMTVLIKNFTCAFVCLSVCLSSEFEREFPLFFCDSLPLTLFLYLPPGVVGR